MKAFVEHLSGVVRVGPETAIYGDPFDFAVAYSSVDGKTATIKALVSPDKDFTISHAKAVIKALKDIGLNHIWERKS